MTTDKSFRINLTVSARDMDRLKALYERTTEYLDKLSFTGFCQVLLMVKASEMERGEDLSLTPTVKRGRPKVSE